jgi:hypothetical protein
MHRNQAWLRALHRVRSGSERGALGPGHPKSTADVNQETCRAREASGSPASCQKLRSYDRQPFDDRSRGLNADGKKLPSLYLVVRTRLFRVEEIGTSCPNSFTGNLVASHVEGAGSLRIFAYPNCVVRLRCYPLFRHAKGPHRFGWHSVKTKHTWELGQPVARARGDPQTPMNRIGGHMDIPRCG